jgi:hypothetical protein
MLRWTKWRTTGLVAATLVVGLLAPTGFSAHARPASAAVQLDRARTIRTGTTTVTTASGVADKLLGASIAAFVTAPGHSTFVKPATGPSKVIATYPVTGGSIGLKPPRGVIRHNGGLFLANLSNGKQVQVDKFIIDLKAKVLTAHVVGTTLRLPVFNLANAVIRVRRNVVNISRVSLRLTATAASALDGALGTTVFTTNMLFGNARSRVVLR